MTAFDNIDDIFQDLEDIGLGSDLDLLVHLGINSNLYLYTNTKVSIESLFPEGLPLGVRFEIQDFFQGQITSNQDFVLLRIKGPAMRSEKFYDKIMGLPWIDPINSKILEKKYI
jgi:hypothetical protein